MLLYASLFSDFSHAIYAFYTPYFAHAIRHCQMPDIFRHYAGLRYYFSLPLLLIFALFLAFMLIAITRYICHYARFSMLMPLMLPYAACCCHAAMRYAAALLLPHTLFDYVTSLPLLC